MNKLKSIYYLLFFAGLSGVLVSCNGLNVKPDLTKGFIKYYGGSLVDTPSEVQITSDGGYVIVGSTANGASGGSDIYVIKTDDFGNEVWEKRFGGSFADFGSSIKATSDGGYIVSGTYGLDLTSQSATYLMKIDAQGSLVWESKIGTKGSGAEVQVAKNGGYYMIANDSSGAYSKIFLYKADEKGNKIFQSEGFGYNNANTIGSSILEESPDSLFTWVGSFVSSPILAGNRPGGNFFAYLKDQPFISDPSLQSFEQIRKTNDNGYIIAGTCIKNGTNKAFLMKLGSDLKSAPSKLWLTTYGGKSDEGASSVALTSDGGYILCGYTESIGQGGKDIYLVKTDANGLLIWEKSYGGVSDDEGVSVHQTADGGYIVAASFSLITTPSNNKIICLIKTDANGDIVN